MAYAAKVLLDSVNSDGDRLTTLEITYPRFVHAELMTHRQFSRNAASSRAIPVEKMIQRVQDDPAMPVWWGRNQSGMQAYEPLTGQELERAKGSWLLVRDAAVFRARELNDGHAHKQIVNRILEPFMWITVIVSATAWNNFLALRQDDGIPGGATRPEDMINPAFPAQPEIQVIAYMMREALNASHPMPGAAGTWHLPMVEEYPKVADVPPDFIKISAGRCARISYLTHDGRRDPAEDIRLHDDLVRNRHWSPLEHQAQAAPGEKSGNFTGWWQYRKQFEGESGEG